MHLELDTPDRPGTSLETTAYYVVSEAVTNAVKHSGASEIVVTIRKRPTAGLDIMIVDDGIGSADPSVGSSLTGLVDRVEAMGGRFAIESPPQRGTKTSVEFPLDPATATEISVSNLIALVNGVVIDDEISVWPVGACLQATPPGPPIATRQAGHATHTHASSGSPNEAFLHQGEGGVGGAGSGPAPSVVRQRK